MQNAQNRGLRSDNKSGLRGVSWDKKTGRWRAQISIDRKVTYLGSFTSPEKAYERYCEASRKHFGEFARNA